MARRSVGAAHAPPPSDAELILRSRAGERDAFAELYERHVGAARAAARSYARSRSDADDLVSDAFAKVLNALSNDGGPEVAFRPYLLTCVRNAAFDRSRRDRKVRFTDEVPEAPPSGAPGDPAVDGMERRLTAEAFAGLPERWRMVLWHTEVEGMSPAQIAPLLGIAPNAVAALSYRAREGLREAYLQAHVRDESDEDCRWTSSRLGAFVRDRLPRRERPRVEAHLDGCPRCRAALDELAAVNQSLRAVLGPIVLGAASTKYLAGLGAGGVKAGLGSLSWAQAIVAAPAKAALVGVAATATVATVTVTTVAIAVGGGGSPVAAGSHPSGSGRPPVTAPAPTVIGGSGDPAASPTTTPPTTTSTTAPAVEATGDSDDIPADPGPPADATPEPVPGPDPGPSPAPEPQPTPPTTTPPTTTPPTTTPPTTTPPTTTPPTPPTTTPPTTTPPTTTPPTTTPPTTTPPTTTPPTTTPPTTVPPGPAVEWDVVTGGAGISLGDDGRSVGFGGSGERRLLADAGVAVPYRITLHGMLTRPAGYPDELPGPSLGYGVFVGAAVTRGGAVSGYTFQVDPGVGGFKLACWDPRGDEHTIRIQEAPASSLFGSHAVDILAGTDGRLAFRVDGVDVFGGPVDLGDLASPECRPPAGDRVGLRAWSSTGATVTGFTVSSPAGGAAPLEASGAGAWSPLLLGLGPVAGLVSRRRARRPRRGRRAGR